MSRLLHQLESEVMAMQPASSQMRCLKLLHSARQSLQVRVRPPHSTDRHRTCAECCVAPGDGPGPHGDVPTDAPLVHAGQIHQQVPVAGVPVSHG